MITANHASFRIVTSAHLALLIAPMGDAFALEPKAVSETVAYIKQIAFEEHRKLLQNCIGQDVLARQKPFFEWLARMEGLPSFVPANLEEQTAAECVFNVPTRKCTIEIGHPLSEISFYARATILVHELRHFFENGIQERYTGVETEERAFEATAVFWRTIRGKVAPDSSGYRMMDQMTQKFELGPDAFFPFVRELYKGEPSTGELVEDTQSKIQTMRMQLRGIEGDENEIMRSDFKLLQDKLDGFMNEFDFVRRGL